MSTTQERILVVEADPEISDLIARQALIPMGYQVKVISVAPKAIQEAVRLLPDVMIVNLNLPGLSGKDLLVALSSQGLNMPVIVIAEQGMERDVIQAFRLGASDYLGWPIREAEVVSAVERALEQVRARRERDHLVRQVKKTNQELQSRVRELTTIFGIGKAVTSITDRRALFDKIVEGAVYVAEADKGWLLLRKGDSRTFLLSAHRNLPKSIASKINQPWDDGISSLVSLSGETLSIHGTPLDRFKVSRLGKSALVVPVKAQKEVVGLLVAVREKANPFSSSSQTLLEALADYVSISLVNVRLFQAVEERTLSLKKAAEASRENEQSKAAILENASQGLRPHLMSIAHQVDLLSGQSESSSSADQKDAIRLIREHLGKADRVVESLASLQKASSPQNLVTVNLSDLARQAIARFQHAARERAVTLHSKLPAKPIFVMADIDHIAQVFDALLSNAVRFSAGDVSVYVGLDKSGKPYAAVHDTGPGIDEEYQTSIFYPFYQAGTSAAKKYAGLGIGLALAKEIVKAHGGEMWVKSQPSDGSTFYFTLRPPK
ncbi:MAG: response regulator [Chloroflexi bacterium]|nr:response regulator [Chloroflexota bacterium]